MTYRNPRTRIQGDAVQRLRDDAEHRQSCIRVSYVDALHGIGDLIVAASPNVEVVRALIILTHDAGKKGIVLLRFSPKWEMTQRTAVQNLPSLDDADRVLCLGLEIGMSADIQTLGMHKDMNTQENENDHTYTIYTSHIDTPYDNNRLHSKGNIRINRIKTIL
jgi:hypothetical protein